MRYAIKAVREHGTFYIYALAPLTNPAWTDSLAKAATYGSRSYAVAKAKAYQLTDVEIIPVTSA